MGNYRRLSHQRAHILAVLAARPGQVVQRDALLEDVWRERTDDARKRLKTQVNQLRAKLGDGLSIEFRLNGYCLCGSLDRLDSTRFESLVTATRDLDPVRAAGCHEQALALWRGASAFAGVDSLLVDEGRRALEALRISTVLAFARCELEMRRPTNSLGPLLELFVDAPERSDITFLAASLLALAGRPTEGLRAIERHRVALGQAGLVLSPELSRLETRILRHELVGAPLPAEAAFPSRLAIGEPQQTGLLRRVELESTVVEALQVGPVVLHGEPGVGKTVLATQVCNQVGADRPVVTVTARSDPLRPIDVVAELVEQLERIDPTAFQRYREDPMTAAAVDRLLGRYESTSRPLSRERLLDELTKLVQRVVGDTRAVLVFEDAHWFDRASAEVVDQLVAAGTPYVLLTTRRAPADAQPNLFVVAVPPFTAAEVQLLLEHTLPVRASATLADDLHVQTGGNGLFLRLKLELLADGQLGRQLPMTVLHAVHERTAGLSRATRDALQTAALLGPSFPLAPLLEVHHNLLDVFADAIDEKLVRVDVAKGVGEFMHGLVADALVHLLTPVQQSARHDQLCLALQKHNGSPISIATQALGAVDLDPERACRTCLIAAQLQAEVFAWHAATVWARRGLEALEAHRVHDAALEADLCMLLGCGLRRANQAGSAPQLLRAAMLADELGDPERFVRSVTELCLHGPTTHAGTVDSHAKALLERALQLSVRRSTRVELLSAAATVYAVSDDSATSRTLYRQALDLADASGDERLLRVVRMNAHLGLAHPDDVEERRRAAVGLLGSSDIEAQWEGRFLDLGLALIAADRVQFDASMQELRRLTGLVRQRDRRRALTQMEAVGALLRGELDAAADLVEEALRASQDGYPRSWALSSYAAIMFPVRDVQGRLGELVPALAGLMDASPSFITWHAVAACLAYATRDESTMARELRYLAERDYAFAEDFTWSAIATIVARPIWALSDRQAARQVYPRLVRLSGAMTWNGLSTHGPVDAGLACLAAVVGDGGAVRRHITIADETLHRMSAAHLRWPELQELSQQWDLVPHLR